MRQKERQCIITFHTTTQAMLFEQAAKAAGFMGRIIPIPREITAGCGLAWKDAANARSNLERLLTDQKLYFDKIYELML